MIIIVIMIGKNGDTLKSWSRGSFKIAGNKAKGLISKRVFQENKAR